MEPGNRMRRVLGRGYFSGVYRDCGRSETDGTCGSHGAPRVPPAAARGQSSGRAIRRAGRFICTLPGSYADSYCAGHAVHAAGAVAVQFDDSCASSAVAPLERASFCYLWICDRNFGADHEFWDAGDWRRESSRRDHAVRMLLFAGAVQGILAYPAARSCAAPRVDDSRIFDWLGGSHDPADYGDIFRH